MRAALVAADYRFDAVVAALGPVAHAALSRNETTPGMRATTGGSPLDTLIRLWLLQAPVEETAAERALPGLVDTFCGAGFLERSVASVRARVDVRPYAEQERDWWVVSDLTPGLDASATRVAADHVLGVSAASTSLAQLTVRTPVASALDLGTGSGVQFLHLAGHAERVVATDVNPRAVRMARLNALLNGVEVDVRAGNLFEPVRADAFDLLVTNPPFVVSPGTGELLTYRDSGLPGDEMVRRVVEGAGDHLAPGGVAQVLVNWVHIEGEPWQERVSGWLDKGGPGRGCDAWVVQREVADPAQYVELWLRDAGHDRSDDYTARYDAWLGWFAEQGVTGIGFGWVNLHRADRDQPSRTIEEWPYEVEQPLGGEVAGWVRREDILHGATSSELLDRRWTVRRDVREESVGPPGAPDPEAIVLRQQRGMRRAWKADTLTAALVGASDGDLTARQILMAVAELTGTPADLDAMVPVVTELVRQGFLVAGVDLQGPLDKPR